MATYTNPTSTSMPTKLNEGDVLVFNTTRSNISFPAGRYRVDVKGAEGGRGGDQYTGVGPVFYNWGGQGSSGVQLSKVFSLTGSELFAITIGVKGSNGGDNPQAGGGGSGYTTLKINNVIHAIAGGGGGGTGVYFGAKMGIFSLTWASSTFVNSGSSAFETTPGTTGGSYRIDTSWTGSAAYSGTGELRLTYQDVPNEVPSSPSNVIASPAPSVGSETTVSWNPAYDPDGDAITYALQRRNTTTADPDAWSAWTSNIYTGPDIVVPDSIPEGWAKVQWRVSATDTHGASAGWVESVQYIVDQNHAPTVSGANGDLGVKNGAFAYDFSINDVDPDDVLTTVVSLDGAEIQRIPNAVRGQTYTAEVSALRWAMSAHGAHELTITALDDKGGMGVRRMTWSRTVMGVDVIVGPINGELEVMPEQLLLSPLTTLTPDATLTVLACNNAFDASPTWEDVTDAVINRRVSLFANAAKTSESWGIKVRVTIRKGTIPGLIELREIGGSYK